MPRNSSDGVSDMIDDDNHPEMQKALRGLMERLALVVGGQVNKSLVDRMSSIVKDHRDEWRARGVDFPVLRALVVPRLGIIDWVRADSDIKSTRIKILNFVRLNPRATMQEVVAAFIGAYPDLKPDQILQHRQVGLDANARQSERMQRNLREAGFTDDEIGPADGGEKTLDS